ncbi:secretin N-terminal domain-containing protein [Burkholderia pyrrocinia]|uniref:secretin N-terminal domain-containing protein n=1 Tax=Burkholderia pyrrocinia TaxID=60550 RepID=UPI00158A5A7C|nr:secretin N-terminal domain-containing protein [Burkholderia pyrrocinia]
MFIRTVLLLCGTVLLLTGCSVDRGLRASEAATEQGDLRGAVDILHDEKTKHPDDIRLATRYYGALDRLAVAYSRDAQQLLADGEDDAAIAALQVILQYDPGNLGVRRQIERIRARARLRPLLDEARTLEHSDPRRALANVRQILSEFPNDPEALELRAEITSTLASADNLAPRVSPALKRTISLNFNAQPLSSAFATISRLTGAIFTFDKDVNISIPVTIVATQTTAEDAINLLLLTGQLEKKALNANTFLIYPARPDKLREYRDLAVRVFFMSYADPKLVAAQVKQILKPREVQVDERLNAVVVRDGLDTIGAVERLVQALDLPQSEVTLEVQALEMSTSDARELGIQYPESFDFSPVNGATGIPIGNLTNLTKDDLLVRFGDPVAKINALAKAGRVEMLAHPRIRVKNREQAVINIGERLPVVTTTTNANGFVGESVAYQEVGLKLEIEPNISLSDEISIKLAIDISNITNTVKTTTGLIAYVLGTRGAKTTMTARNNEPQIVGGLIRRSDMQNVTGLPFLSRLPLVGSKLFGTEGSSQESSEIIVVITPRIERNIDLPAAQISTFMSGTESRTSIDDVVLPNSKDLNATVSGATSTSTAAPSPPVSAPSGNWQPLPPPVASLAPRPAASPGGQATPANTPPGAVGANGSTASSGGPASASQQTGAPPGSVSTEQTGRN